MSDLYIPYFDLRFNTNLQSMEYNSGGESWLQVPVPTGDLGLLNGKILVGNASNLAAAVTLSGDATITNAGVITVSNSASVANGAITPAKIAGSGDFVFPGNGRFSGALLAIGGTTEAFFVSGHLIDVFVNGNIVAAFSTAALSLSTGYGLTVGTDTADASALVTEVSTTKGHLFPRMTNTQRDAIASPAEGLTIYSTSDHALEFYNGTTWKVVATV